MSEHHMPQISFSPDPGQALPDMEAISQQVWRQPHTNMAAIHGFVEAAKQAHNKLQNYRHVVVIGTGGSTLGAKMLCAFGAALDRVLFVETVDAHSVYSVLAQVDLEHTLFLVVSKSGSTIETLTLYNLFVQKYPPQDIAKHFVFVTDPEAKTLRQVAAQFGATVLDHPAEVGGRFSIFTLVGLLPALFAGVEIDEFIAGGEFYQAEPFWQQTAAWHLARYKEDKTITVMLPYLDRLNSYTYWWRQLWAESLGKGGHFTTPFASIGSVDQHSQLQLWLDGKRDKSFTLISVEKQQSLSIDDTYLPSDIYGFVSGQTTQTIQHALVTGTIHSLKKADLPVCHIHFHEVGAFELGVLVMHGFAEITALAHALGINPYGQPAVEVGKSKAKELLSK